MRIKSITDAVVAVLLHLLTGFFSILPLDVASGLGGWFGRTVGPLTPLHRRAHDQLRTIFPSMGPPEVRQTLRTMWDNLGRTFAEYPHLPQIGRERAPIENRANFTREALHGHAAIFIAGHFANWEVSAAALYAQYGTPLDLVYRAPNNAHIDRLLTRYRTMGGLLTSMPKSRSGMRAIVGALTQNRKVGILIDQKYNEGIAVPFFGRPAMTTTAFAQLGQKFNCPVYPAQVIRTKGAHFKIVIYPALNLYAEGGAPLPLKNIAATANAMLETWMHEQPAQWLWVHRRWSSRAVQDQ